MNWQLWAADDDSDVGFLVVIREHLQPAIQHTALTEADTMQWSLLTFNVKCDRR